MPTSYPAYGSPPGIPPIRTRRDAATSQVQQYTPAFDETAHAKKIKDYTNGEFNRWYAGADLTPFVQPNQPGGGINTGISITKSDGSAVSQKEQHDPTNLNDPAVASIARQNARTHYLRNVLPYDPRYSAMQAQAALARQSAGMPIAPPLKPSEQLAQERLKLEQQRVDETARHNHVAETTAGVGKATSGFSSGASSLAGGLGKLVAGIGKGVAGAVKGATPKPSATMNPDDRALLMDDLIQFRARREKAQKEGTTFTEKLPLPSDYIGRAKQKSVAPPSDQSGAASPGMNGTPVSAAASLQPHGGQMQSSNDGFFTHPDYPDTKYKKVQGGYERAE